MSRRDDDGLISGIGAAAGLWALLIVLVMLFVFMCVWEWWRIYRRDDLQGSTEKVVLGYAGGALLVVLILTAILIAASAVQAALWLLSISFLVWVIVIEYIDHSHPQHISQDDPSIDDVLGPWKFAQRIDNVKSDTQQVA